MENIKPEESWTKNKKMMIIGGGVLLVVLLLVLIICIAVFSSQPTDTTIIQPESRKLIKCTDDSNCSLNQKCISGICKLNDNEKCSMNEYCISDSCVNGLCVDSKYGGHNGECYTSDNNEKYCQQGLKCDLESNKCIGNVGFYQICDGYDKQCSQPFSCLNIDMGTKCRGDNSCICDFSYSPMLVNNDLKCIIGLEEEDNKCLNKESLPCGIDSTCISNKCNIGELAIAKINYGDKLYGTTNVKIEKIDVDISESIGQIKKVSTFEMNSMSYIFILSMKGIFIGKVNDDGSLSFDKIFKGNSMKIDGHKYVIDDIISNGTNIIILFKNPYDNTTKLFITDNTNINSLSPYSLLPYNTLSGIQYYIDSVSEEFKEINIKSIDLNDNNIILITGSDGHVFTAEVPNDYTYESLKDTDNTDNVKELASYLFKKTDDIVTNGSAKFYDNIGNNNYSYIHDNFINMKGDYEHSSQLIRYMSIYKPLNFTNYYVVSDTATKKASNIAISIIAENKNGEKSLFISNSNPKVPEEMKFGNILFNIDKTAHVIATRDTFYIINKGICM